MRFVLRKIQLAGGKASDRNLLAFFSYPPCLEHGGFIFWQPAAGTQLSWMGRELQVG